MNTPAPPTPPDPVATANAQGAMNKDTAISQAQLNMVDQTGPQGSSSYEQTGSYADGTPKFKQTVTLSPAQQALYDSQNSISQQALGLGQNAIGKVQSAIDKPFDISGLPGQVYGVGGDNSARMQAVQDALMSRLNPQIAQDRNRLDTKLANQGITQGSDAYNRAQSLGEQNVNDARMQAILAASQEDSRLFGQDVTNANLQNAGRQQGIQEAAYLRSQPINELASLMGFSPGVQVPNFQNPAATGIAPPDYQGAVANNYNGQMDAWKAKSAANSSMLGSIFGLGGALGGAWIGSDRRLKTKINRIGTASNGLPIYSYEYKSGGPAQIGFMADDVKKVKPWAVINRDGFDMVNYSLAAV